MKKPFLLILSASGGAGHIRAAEALVHAARSGEFDLHAEHYDCLDFTTKTFKRLYAGSYLSMVNHLPEFWGYLYSQSEKKAYTKKGLLNLFDHFNYQHYVNTLSKLNPDAIICTHFLPYISISERARKSNIRAPFFAATTDFDVHQLWVDKIVSHYYVYHEESAWQLASKGISPEKISVKGIPVSPEFASITEKRVARHHLELPTNRFTVVVLAGGFGVGHVKEISESVSSLLGTYAKRSFNLILICGKNESLKREMEQKVFPHNIHVSVHGFVSNIYALMDAADILVSKSGGLTSAEAMAKHLPLIIVDPIPGQESRNASIMVERGAALLALDLHNLQFKLKRVIEEASLLRSLREGTESLGKPRAAFDILNDVCARISPGA